MMICSNEELVEYLKSRDFPAMSNTRILDVAKGNIPDKLPIWIMRQAGRYLPEFKELRAKHDFFDICQNPRLACEVTLMPIKRFDLDAAIIFSDILVIPQALGMTCIMEKEKGPVFPSPLTLDDMSKLTFSGAIDRLKYVGEAITLTRHILAGKVPLIGFSACPWTLMVYMIEGGGTKTASKAKKWLYKHRSESIDLLTKLSDVIIDYVVMQIEAGAQMIQLFESSAEYLGQSVYDDLMIPQIKRIHSGILSQLQTKQLSRVPMIYFAKGGGHFLSSQVELGFDVISLDWNTDPKLLRNHERTPCLQGNLDPCALYADKDTLIKHAKHMVKAFGYKKYIVNLGHGIYPDVPVEAVQWLIDFVHSVKND